MTIGHLFKGLASDTLLALFIRTALAIEGNAFIYPVIFPVLINFFKQLLLIDFGRTINSLLVLPLFFLLFGHLSQVIVTVFKGWNMLVKMIAFLKTLCISIAPKGGDRQVFFIAA